MSIRGSYGKKENNNGKKTGREKEIYTLRALFPCKQIQTNE